MAKKSCYADLKRNAFTGNWRHERPGVGIAFPFDYVAGGERAQDRWRDWANENKTEEIQIHWTVASADSNKTVVGRGMVSSCFQLITGIEVDWRIGLRFSARRKVNGKWRPWWTEK